MRFSSPSDPVSQPRMLASLRHFLALALLSAGILAGPSQAAPFAYVALHGTNKVAVLDMASSTVVNEIVVGQSPLGIAVSSSGRHAYVANMLSHNVSIIDTQTNTVVDSFSPMAVSGLPWGIAVHPDGTRLYVTNYGADTLSVIDTATKLPLAQISVRKSKSVAVNRAGTLAYAAQTNVGGPGTLVVIDLSSNSIVTTLPVPVLGNIEFSPDGLKAYVVSGRSVAVIDTISRTQTASWLGSENGTADVESLTLSSDGRRLYLVTSNDKTLSILDTSTGAALNRVVFGDAPTSVVVDSVGQKAIVTGSQTGLSATVDLRTNQVVKVAPIGSGPVMFGSVVLASQPVTDGTGGGGGGCGFISGFGGPPDPTLPMLAALALLMIGMRSRWPQR